MNKETILKASIVILLIIAVVSLIWFMVGDSPTAEHILLIFVLPLYVFMFGVYEKLNSKVERVQRMVYHAKETFQKELGEIKQTLGRIEGRLEPQTK